MSLKYRNASGVETPVAGLNGTSGELVPSVALQQSGRDNHPQSTVVEQGYQTSYTVTFTTPMPDADYEIVLSPIRVESVVSLNSKTENGFTYYIRVLSPVSGDFGADWTAVKFMTDEVHEADSNHIARNTANFAPAFSDVTSYAVGDYCTYNNVLYRCTTAHTAGVWVAGHFTQVTVGSDLNYTNPKVEKITTNEVSLTIVKQGRIVIFNGVFTNQVAQGQDIYVNLNDMYMPISNIICGVVHENQGGIAAGNSLVSMAKISNFNNQVRVEMYSYSAIPVGASISGSYICAN